jgi:adenylate cyclase
VFMGFLSPLVGLRFGPVFAALAGVAAAVVFTLAAQAAFGNGLIVSFLYPMAALALGVVGSLGQGLVVDAFERERMRDLFSRFVPEAVVDEVLARVDEDLRLGGTKRTVTVLFSDIRGFTTFSEGRPPDQVIEILNRYLTIMSDVILDHGGTLVSYMGDGIMAVFGAPMDQPDHADLAVAAAREMTGPALERFNEWARENGVEDGFRIGVGMMSGPVMAGNVGSERRLEYTTIGDTVNTASRLEGMTKGTPHMIYLADSTRAMLTRERNLIAVDELPVRGRKEPVKVWSVDGAGGEA